MTFANGSNAYIFYQKYLETFLKKNRIYKQTCCKNKKHMELYNRKNCTYLETFLKKNRIYKQTCCKNKKHMELYNHKNCTYLNTFLKENNNLFSNF